MELKYQLKGLDCANCAAKIERSVSKVEGVKKAQVDFMQSSIAITCDLQQAENVEIASQKAIKKIEPDVTMVKKGTEHEHQHEHGHTKPKVMMGRILLTAGIMLLLILLKPIEPLNTIFYATIYLLIGYDIVKTAVLNLFSGQLFDENFLMTVATIGAFLIGDRPEAVLVMLLYQIGEFFQDYAVNQSKKNIKALMDVRPDRARLVTNNGLKIVKPESVAVGDVVQVNPGEKIPLDGTIKEGIGYIDTSALTGESMPQLVEVGNKVLSGSVNKDTPLTIQVTESFGQSTVSKILDLVENASSKKAPAEKFITKFARVYTPIVVGLAVLLAIIPPLFGGDLKEWLYRALTFLVISCPCALVISVPLSFFGGIGGASRAGILIKGSNYLEKLAKVDTVVFDKTGTLTKGQFAVEEIVTLCKSIPILTYASALEQNSSHPIARSIVTASAGEVLPDVTETREIAGFGVMGTIEGQKVFVGNEKYLKENNISFPAVTKVGTIVYVVVNEKLTGYLVINDQIKSDAKAAVTKLKANGIKKTVMLTGDSEKVAASVGGKLGLNQVFARLLPADKVEHVQKLRQAGGKVAFVGDGINDAPVLASADIGIAMGGLGSDAAIEAADAVIMDDKPTKIATGIEISRKTLRIVKQNIVFALTIKIFFLLLGAGGIVTMGWAVFADVGVTLIAVLNAMRCLRVPKK